MILILSYLYFSAIFASFGSGSNTWNGQTETTMHTIYNTKDLLYTSTWNYQENKEAVTVIKNYNFQSF